MLGFSCDHTLLAKFPGALLVVLSGAWLIATATAAQARVPFTVVDSKGVTVGPAMDLSVNSDGSIVRVSVPFRAGQKRIVLHLNRKGYITESREHMIYFERQNCEGQAYVRTATSALTNPILISGSRHTLYVADQAFREVDLGSHFNFGGSYPGCGNFGGPPGSNILTLRPLVRLLDLDDRFTPPFKLGASEEAIDLAAP